MDIMQEILNTSQSKLADKVSELQKRVKDKNFYPHDIPVEMSLIGSCLLGDPKTFHRVRDIVSAQDFYRISNMLIFESMERCIKTHGAIDIVLLSEDLTTRNVLEQCGGLAYLMQVGELVPTTAHAVQYATLVKKLSNYRNIVVQSEYAIARCQDGELSPDDIVLDFGKSTADSLPESAVESAYDLLTNSLGRLTTGAIAGISTGIGCIDSVIGGFRKGELIILGARPSVGKSALGLQYAYNVAKKQAGNVLFVSIEMSGDMIAQRLIQMVCHIDGTALHEGYLSADEEQRIYAMQEELKSLPLRVSTQSPLTINSIRAKARDVARDGDIALIVVDYLQMIEVTGSQGRTRDIGVISRGLKALAREFNTPVVALSSLSRATETRTDKRPIMSDLRESGDIESDADVVQFLYRPDYYEGDRSQWDEMATSDTELITAKNRNGKIGVSLLSFEKRFAYFSDNTYNGGL